MWNKLIKLIGIIIAIFNLQLTVASENNFQILLKESRKEWNIKKYNEALKVLDEKLSLKNKFEKYLIFLRFGIEQKEIRKIIGKGALNLPYPGVPIPGIAPESIKDLEVRKGYIKAREENARRITYSNYCSYIEDSWNELLVDTKNLVYKFTTNKRKEALKKLNEILEYKPNIDTLLKENPINYKKRFLPILDE